VVHDWRQDATHVVTQLPLDAVARSLGTADLPPSVHVVEGDWVSECLRQNELVDDATFRIPFGVRVKQLQEHLVHDVGADGEGSARPAAMHVDSDAEEEEEEEGGCEAYATATSAAPAKVAPCADGDEAPAESWDNDDFRVQERTILHPPVVDVDGTAQAMAAAALKHIDAPVLTGLPASGVASHGAEPLPPEQAKATSTSPWEHSKTAAAPWDAIRAAYDGSGSGGAAMMPPQLVSLAEALHGADAIELPVAAAGAAAATAPRSSYATAAEYPRPQWSDDEEEDGDDGAPDAPTLGPDPITQQLQVRVHFVAHAEWTM